MNDPQVVALIYTVEHKNSVSYDDAKPLRNFKTPEFDLTVEDKVARFEFTMFYASVAEARKAIEPFILQWEFEAGIQRGPNSFSLRFKEAEIRDRNPSPPGGGIRRIRPAGLVLSSVSASARLTHVVANYPPPPAGGSVDLDDCIVDKMKTKYEKYRLGRTALPETANFCVTCFMEKYGSLSEAARQCGISKRILNRVSELAAKKGGEDARKAEGFGVEFTRQEKRFLKKAVKEIIIRAAQVAADSSQRHPQITMADLPPL